MMIPGVTPYEELEGLFYLVAISSAAFTVFALTCWWAFDCTLVRVSSAMLVSSCWVAIASAGYYNLAQYGEVEQVLSATHGMYISDDYQIASTTVTELGDGIRLVTERYSDGRTNTTGSLPNGQGRIAGESVSDTPRDPNHGREAVRLVPLSAWRGFTDGAARGWGRDF